ncbi:MAG: hypothetical protein BHV92_03615 [Clostridiales bacterium 45_37]|nr:MAG: hypothetical protein BHV92_03615 [Clostridiales bacterium 45_37]
MDDRRFAFCHARFFCRPNAGNGFEDISNYRKAGITHECKKTKAGAHGKKEMDFGELAASETAQAQQVL